MRIITIFLFSIITTTCYCQTSDEDTIVLKAGIDTTRFKGEIIYANKIVGWERLQYAFAKTTLRSEGGEKLFSKLSKSEWRHLHEELRKNKNLFWKEALFANSIMITTDSVWSEISKKSKEYFAQCQELSLKKDTLLLPKMYLRMPRIFFFSKPVYFRNNSVCLVFYEWICGRNCGEYEILVLKKSNGSWQRWFVARRGIY